MKRGLVFSLCALALATTVQAQHVDISLNLRYTDPADPSEGGKWFLAVKTTHANGVAGVSAYITGIDTAGAGAPVFGVPTAVGSTAAQYEAVTGATLGANVSTVGGTPYNFTGAGGVVNVVFGMDNSPTGAIVAGVGTATFDNDPSAATGRQEADPLQNATWNNSTIIMSGGFGATRPAFATLGANSTDANILGGAPTLGANAIDATVALFVRGDALETLDIESNDDSKGLLAGDADRSGTVNGDDFTLLGGNWQQPGGWDQGDFNDSGTVDGDDFTLLGGNWQQSQIPVSAVGVPEPASVALALVAGLGGVGLIRRRNK